MSMNEQVERQQALADAREKTRKATADYEEAKSAMLNAQRRTNDCGYRAIGFLEALNQFDWFREHDVHSAHAAEIVEEDGNALIAWTVAIELYIETLNQKHAAQLALWRLEAGAS